MSPGEVFKSNIHGLAEFYLFLSQGDCDYTSPPFRNLEIEEMIRNYELEVTYVIWQEMHIAHC